MTIASRPRWSTMMALAIVVVMVSACGESVGFRTDEASGVEFEPTLTFVIPEGAGEAYDAGTPLEILPARLEVSIGDSIEIRNDDDRGHLIGPFFVAADETLRQTFASAGEFIGDCTVHSSGEIVVVVT